MAYLFDHFGWYSGQGESRRSTNVAPTNTSTTTTPGELRSNWTGRNWVETPYFAPAQATLAEVKKLALVRAKAELLKRQYAFTIGGFSYADFQQTLDDGSIVNALDVTKAILDAGGNRYAVVSDSGDNIIMNTAKLNSVLLYMYNCSEAAITHYQAIRALTTKAQVASYVNTTLPTGWPNETLV